MVGQQIDQYRRILMHTTFGCACLLTDKFVVVADVFFRKNDGEGCSSALSQSVRKPPCLDNRQRHSFDDQRLTVFIGDTCHLAHNGPETLGNRFIVFGREPFVKKQQIYRSPFDICSL